MAISRAQCRAARGLLGWTQAELANRVEMSKKSINEFEIGIRTPYPKNMKDIQKVLEDEGVVFFSTENELQDGVAFRWGTEDPKRAKRDIEREEKEEEARKAMHAFWIDNPQVWAEMPLDAREALAARMGTDMGEDLFGRNAE